jgi:predicted metal-dependent peptidase
MSKDGSPLGTPRARARRRRIFHTELNRRIQAHIDQHGSIRESEIRAIIDALVAVLGYDYRPRPPDKPPAER